VPNAYSEAWSVRQRQTTTRKPSGASLRCRSKVWIERDGDIALSNWRIELLEAVAATGSLAQAAVSLGVPYRTAWAKLKHTEECLGVRLIATKSGGAAGGGSELTPEALDLIARFRRASAGVAAFVEARFRAEFGDLLG
jgi:molybdate transport system regulatory protein